MWSSEDKVCALIVTYGDRWKFLKQVISQLLTFSQIKHIIIVDNASECSVTGNVNKLNDSKIHVINSIRNEGSAGGYKKAIEFGIEHTDADFFWLLDDDNVPEEKSLSGLHYEWEKIEGANNRKALFCLRDDRAQHVRIAKGENPYRYYLVPDNFLGFNLFRIFINQFYKVRAKLQKNGVFKERVKMPYVPYGGLFFHRSIIKDIGYPNEHLFLYVDDSEYTYRITQLGGTIWLIPACKVIDIDKSQGLNFKKSLFHSHLLDQWNFRTYYHVRNRMYFYSEAFIENPMIFKLNKFLYLNYLRIISLLSSRQTEYRKLLVAVDDGLKGKLGEADPSKF
jgi:GT2 family glycosyltransferase